MNKLSLRVRDIGTIITTLTSVPKSDKTTILLLKDEINRIGDSVKKVMNQPEAGASEWHE
ncbi:MAG: hypothetical protein P8P11_04820 [Burkholderiales bacterium]|nr:hypothetical protein [Burkholderiales bacterium]